MGIVNFDGTPVCTESLQCMIDSMSYRGRMGSASFIERGVGMAVLFDREAVHTGLDRPLRVIGDRTLVADLRFDDSNALASRFGLDPECSRESILRSAVATSPNAFPTLLTGDFAIASWDPVAGTLLLARDALGVRPLVYSILAGRRAVVFASDSRPLLALLPQTPAVDLQSMSDFLLFGRNLQRTRTIHEGIHRVPAAHTVEIKHDGPDVECRHWSPPSSSGGWHYDADETVARFTNLLEIAVQDRLPINGNVGTMLSGGLDSTSIARIATDLRDSAGAARARHHTFTGIRARPRPDPERDLAKQLALSLRTTHHELPYDREQPGAPVRPIEPFAWTDLSHVVSTYFAMQSQLEISCVLTGGGGDLILRPEPNYVVRQLRGRHFASLAAAVLAYRLRSQVWPRPYLRSTLFHRSHAKRWRQELDRLFPTWLTPNSTQRFGLRERWIDMGMPASLRYDQNRPTYLHDLGARIWEANLALEDPGQFGYSGTWRHPMLDLRLLDFVADLPGIPWLENKELLRSAMRGRMPSAILDRPKYTIGRLVPLDVPGERSMSDIADELGVSSRLAALGLIEPNRIAHIVERRRLRGDILSPHLRNALQAERWLQAD